MRKFSFELLLFGVLILLGLLNNSVMAQKPGPAKADLPNTVISGTPLTIYVGQQGSYQVYTSLFGQDQVYPSATKPADAGILAWYNGVSIGIPGSATGTFRKWVFVSQTPVSGTGSASDPFLVSTTFNDATGISITSITSYVNGKDYFNVQWQITLPTVGDVTTFIAQDLMLGGSDNGLSYYDPATETIGGTNVAHTQYQMFIPVTTPTYHEVDLYNNIWARIGQSGTPGAGFSNYINPSTSIYDNGMGLQYNLSGASTYTINVIWAFSTDSSPAGTLTVTPSSLTGFATTVGTPSASQQFTVSGTGLTADAIVTAPTSYEVSTDNITYQPSVTLAQSGGTLTGQPVPVYVHIAATAPVGSPSGDITVTSTGFPSRSIAVSGIVTGPPSVPVATEATNVAETSFIAHWITSAGVTDYKIDVATDIGFTSIIPDYSDISVGILGYTNITDLTANTPYYYRVRAVNAVGTSGNSNIITVNTVGSTSCPIVTSNITVAPNVNGQLNASGASYYSWIPTTGLSNTNIANPIVHIPSSAIYYVTGLTESTTNLITNGDFEAGNIGFTSAYIYCNSGNCLYPEGYYGVGSNPNYFHDAFHCSDHTTGSGKMMVINGDVTPDKGVWSEIISVTPNTYYAFSTWLETVCTPNPARLQFSINGSLVGNIFTATSSTCGWTQFYCIWHSGSNTSVPISIVNKNTVADGNDFAIDDIKFVELCSATNMVIATVALNPIPPVAIAATNITTTSINANWNSSATATGYYLDVATDLVFANIVSGYNNLDAGNVTTLPVSGLTGGITYYYRIRAYNASGTSENSNIITVFTAPIPPVAIDATNITTTSINANWNSSATATGYYLDVATDLVFTNIVSGYNNLDAGNVTTLPISGLSGGTTYYYRIRAYNTSSTSENSNTITVLTAPIPPVAIAATNITTSSFNANWDPSATATGYYLDVATNADFINILSDYSNLNAGNVTTLPINGLSGGTIYYYRIRAYNASGSSVNSNVITVLTAPIPPVATAAISITATSFNANWNSSLTATGYYLDVATDLGFTNFASGYNNLDVSDVTTFPINGLTECVSYYYRIRAYNESASSENSNTITVLLLPPAPIAIAATNISIPSFEANWNSTSCAIDYKIDVATDSAFLNIIPAYNNLSTGNVNSYSIIGLNANTPYYYRLRANSIYGTSTNSNIITVKRCPIITWANPTDIVYGTPLSSTQLNAIANVVGTFVYSPINGTILNSEVNQDLTVTFSPTDTANYNIVSLSVPINVIKATPVITWANPADIVYGTALGTTQLNATTTIPGTWVYSPSSGIILSPGVNQNLTVTFMPTDYENYNIISKMVQINVVKADPFIIWANPADIVYGTPLSITQLNATADIVGTWVYNPANSTILNAGLNQNLSVTFTPIDITNYNVVTKIVQINVTKANPIITWTNPVDIIYGTPISATQLNATTPIPGTWVYDPTMGTVLNVGSNQDLSVTFTPTDAINYNAVSKTVQINVLKSSPAIQAEITEFVNISGVDFTVNWTRGDGDYCSVFVCKSTSGLAAPIYGINYNADSRFKAGDQIGTSAWYCVYDGTGTSVKVTELTNLTTYRVMVVEYNEYGPNTEYNGIKNYSTYTNANNPLNVETLESIENNIGASNFVSPNGDGINDTWVVKRNEELKDFDLIIFNNIGENIYQSKGYDNKWDASYNGISLPSGTYYYLFKNGGTIMIKGFITVVR